MHSVPVWLLILVFVVPPLFIIGDDVFWKRTKSSDKDARGTT